MQWPRRESEKKLRQKKRTYFFIIRSSFNTLYKISSMWCIAYEEYSSSDRPAVYDMLIINNCVRQKEGRLQCNTELTPAEMPANYHQIFIISFVQIYVCKIAYLNNIPNGNNEGVLFIPMEVILSGRRPKFTSNRRQIFAICQSLNRPKTY